VASIQIMPLLIPALAASLLAAMAVGGGSDTGSNVHDQEASRPPVLVSRPASPADLREIAPLLGGAGYRPGYWAPLPVVPVTLFRIS
jgi:hypothetical protein